MHAHLVLAHPEPNSFNGHLVRAGVDALQARGWKVTGKSFNTIRAKRGQGGQ